MTRYQETVDAATSASHVEYLRALIDLISTTGIAGRIDASQRNISASIERQRRVDEIRARFAKEPPIDRICRIFELSEHERTLLLLCAAPELDWWRITYDGSESSPSRPASLTLEVARAIVPELSWEVLSPEGPLRRLRIVELGLGNTLASSPMRIDEGIILHILGIPVLDGRLTRYAKRIEPMHSLLPFRSHIAGVSRVARLLMSRATDGPAIQIICRDRTLGMSVAAAAAQESSSDPLAFEEEELPAGIEERSMLADLVHREARYADVMPVIACGETVDTKALRAFIRHLNAPVIVVAYEQIPLDGIASAIVDLHGLSQSERRSLWEAGMSGTGIAGEVVDLASHYTMTTDEIVAADLETAHGPVDPIAAGHELLDICRRRSRRWMEELTYRIEPRATWDDLVLAGTQQATLQEIITHLRKRTTVLEEWGFARRSNRGLGTTALFAGASGTGKTLAAEVLAGELDLDLYQIDLSQVIDKYVGETEKKLGRIFDAAEQSEAILLFDESDALFEKRSDVKDSHDRYANIEVSYLLQRMERYSGLAILTTK